MPYASIEQARASARARAKRRYHDRKNSGRCPRCGVPVPDGPGILLCLPCNDKEQDRRDRSKAERLPRGQCRRCSRPIVEGRQYCEHHLRMMAEYSSKRKPEDRHAFYVKDRERRLADGICLKCSANALPGIQLCERHNDINKRNSRSRKKDAQGICARVGCRLAVSEGEDMCMEHFKEEQEIQRLMREYERRERLTKGRWEIHR